MEAIVGSSRSSGKSLHPSPITFLQFARNCGKYSLLVVDIFKIIPSSKHIGPFREHGVSKGTRLFWTFNDSKVSDTNVVLIPVQCFQYHIKTTDLVIACCLLTVEGLQWAQLLRHDRFWYCSQPYLYSTFFYWNKTN